MKAVLIGDSIRMGYEKRVAAKCTVAEVVGPADNCRHGVRVLDHFQEWVADQRPDVVHVNFGIHDASLMPDGEHQILLPQYRLSVQRVIDKIKALDGAIMIWATTTPLYLPEEGRPMSRWRVNARADVGGYNAAAREIASREGVRINDLHEVILRNGFDRCLIEDGCHMTDFGNEVLSDAVVQAIAEAVR